MLGRIIQFAIVVATLCIDIARAEDSLVAGGRSPDGRYEVRIFQTDSRDPSDYYYAVRDLHAQRIIKQLSEGGGYSRYSGATKTATQGRLSYKTHFILRLAHGPNTSPTTQFLAMDNPERTE